MSHAERLVLLTRGSSLLRQIPTRTTEYQDTLTDSDKLKETKPVEHLFVLQDAVDNARRKASDVVNGGKVPRGQNHARIGVDGQRESDIHVHVIEPVVVSLQREEK